MKNKIILYFLVISSFTLCSLFFALILFPPIYKTDVNNNKAEIHIPSSKKIDINFANASEIAAIEGIGEKTAINVVEYRKTNGSFTDIKQLLNIKGIGEKSLEKITQFIVINDYKE